ncbi:glutathione S-transferase [Hankyongella ginsenosidimutans]|uniref:glutathione S-transferase n=1 Tax=Hankyongella ginsenosidimutans TaxID=1763828 RepID=UPI00319D8BB6
MSIILHEYPPSGNCYKLRLLMAHLGLAYARRGYDILKGETRTPDFLAKVNGNGRIPVLEIDGVMLPESNAALYYLAQGTPYWPQDRLGQAQVLQWLFFEQYNHEPNVATVRFWVAFVGEANLDGWQRRRCRARSQPAMRRSR